MTDSITDDGQPVTNRKLTAVDEGQPTAGKEPVVTNSEPAAAPDRETVVAGGESTEANSEPVWDGGSAPAAMRPVVAVVGRPNVGKSMLVNRLTGRRDAVVQDLPGVTRDRVSHDADWGGREFVVVDTGGWAPDLAGLAAQVAEQAELAVATADAVLLVVDAAVGVQDIDEAVVRMLRRSGKPVLLAANKVDDARLEADAALLWNLGLGEPHAVSALHGRGTGDLLDALVALFPPVASPTDGPGPDQPRRVALVGRPNVGKSSLLNKLAGEKRAVVDSVAGTTVDPVDELVEVGGVEYTFIDTAGVRRRVKEASGHEFYASLRTQNAIERAEVCVVLIDAAETISDQDLRILNGVEDAGRALVLAYNKWDLTDDERRHYLGREIEQDIQSFAWAPSVNISALTGRNVDKLSKAIEAALEGWETRVTTGQLNAFLGRLTAAHPHPVRGGKQPRILFGTQAGNCPPTFAIFTSARMDPPYVRFIERRLREEFGFTGTPVRVEIRPRQKRKA
jgi:GTP-binding protein